MHVGVVSCRPLLYCLVAKKASIKSLVAGATTLEGALNSQAKILLVNMVSMGMRDIMKGGVIVGEIRRVGERRSRGS